MKQRILSFLLILCLFAGTIPQLVPTASATTYFGDCGGYGSNLLWALDTDTGVLHISGTGDMANGDFFVDYFLPWYEYRADIKTVIMEPGITSIGDFAFYDCAALTSVTIPDSVTSIGDNAFEGCTVLTSVTIPNSVTHIDSAAFSGCTALTSVSIPDSVTSIGYGAFGNCISLISVTIPDGVTAICNYTFSGCTALTSVTIPNSVTSIGDYAFKGCAGLTSVAIPDGVTAIGREAFVGCAALTSVSIPDGVTSIGYAAFEGCVALTSVSIPDSITIISGSAFKGCTGLTSVIIPDSVTSIGNDAFKNCTALTSVTVPDSASSIGSSAFYNTAYYNEAANWEKDVLYIGNHLIVAKTTISGSYGIREGTVAIADSAFHSCSRLTSVTIPSTVTFINSYAFRGCANLTSVTIPDSVSSISYYAFGDCTKLASVVIPDSVSSIGGYAFYKTAYYNDAANWEGDVLYIGRHLIDSKTTISGSYNIPKETVSIAGYAFRDCASLTSVTIPDSVTSIAQSTFNGCTALTSVTIPDSVTSIGQAAFYDCNSLTSVTIPDSVTSIGLSAFPSRSGFKSLYFLSPSCEIYNYNDLSQRTITMSRTGVIYGFPGSTVEKYAQDHGYTFSPLLCQCDVSLHEHTTEYVAPTCADGGHYLVCKECDCYHLVSSAPAVTAHSYEETDTVAPSCEWTGLDTYTCTECGATKTEATPAVGHSYDEGKVTTQATCISKGVRVYTCTVCGSTKLESIPVTEHRYLLYRNNGADHSVKCITCPDYYDEPHRFTNGRCVCGAVERILDENIRIYHSLNLESSISINYAVRVAELTGYESYYMECILPIYEGNKLLGTERVVLQPVQKGDYYYFILTGMTALEMSNTVDATVHMVKDGKSYISNTDSYSIATYAYDQLNDTAKPVTLRALCANLLRYGAKAQLWKGYRTDTLADAAMTEEQKALLGDLDSVEFGSNNQILGDVKDPVVTWVGKTMSLDSKITVRFVVNTSDYTGDLSNLSLRLSYVNIDGETQNVTLTELKAYNADRNYYAFDFDGLLSTELRSVLRAAVYEGDTQLSATMIYSVDSYGLKTSDSLRTLVQGMIAYSDSARAFFGE